MTSAKQFATKLRAMVDAANGDGVPLLACLDAARAIGPINTRSYQDTDGDKWCEVVWADGSSITLDDSEA